MKNIIQQAITESLDEEFWNKYNADLFEEFKRSIKIEITGSDSCKKIGIGVNFSNDWAEYEWFIDLEEELIRQFSDPEPGYLKFGLLARAGIMDRLAVFFRRQAESAKEE